MNTITKEELILNKKLLIIIPIIVIVIIVAIILFFVFNNKNNLDDNFLNGTNQAPVHNPLEDATLSSGQWPTSGLMSKLPQISVGTVGDVVETDSGTSVSVFNLSLSDYQNYIAQVQHAGFNINEQSTSTTNSVLYSSSNAEGYSIKTSYSTETQKMSLVISQPKNSVSNTNNTSSNNLIQ